MTPRRFAVIGDPIAQSKSPIMQIAAFRALGLPHTYEAVRVVAADVPAVVARLRDGAFDGINVTVPHKTRVLDLVDAVDDGARVAGAANTLVRSADGRLTAYNTDAPALAAELRALGGPGRAWSETRALVLGSGGAARAAVVALAGHLGVRDIVVRARAFADAKRRDDFAATAPATVRAEAWTASAGGEARTGVLVQCTSAGMRGADDGEAAANAVAWDALPSDAVALDVVYAPRETPWLRAARARGLRGEDGLGMLARQGALALELWLGVEAPLAEMRAAIE